jgi:hypothetical protein
MNLENGPGEKIAAAIWVLLLLTKIIYQALI